MDKWLKEQGFILAKAFGAYLYSPGKKLPVQLMVMQLASQKWKGITTKDQHIVFDEKDESIAKEMISALINRQS